VPPWRHQQGGIGNSVTNRFATALDLTTTILEMAGISHPAPTYQALEVVPMHGESMLSFMTRQSASVREKDFIEGWGDARACRSPQR